MENENLEVVVKNKKKILMSISLCVLIVIISLFMFFSNSASKNKIKITQTEIVLRSFKLNGILLENTNKCVVDFEIKGDFYDKDNNWLGEHVYEGTIPPDVRYTVNTWLQLPSLWADQIAWEEYTVTKCKKSNYKMYDVGFSADNDITVNIDKVNNKVTFKNNTNRDIKGDFKLREIYYIKNNCVAEYDVFNTIESVPANKRISFDINEDEDYKRIKEMSEKTETFLYAYEEEM